MRRLLAPLAAAVLLSGCGDDGGGGGSGAGPEAQFASLGCASCHTLEAAGSRGNTGPDLDERKPSVAEAERQIAEGGGGMPSYRSRLSAAEIRALAEYVSKSAGR